MTDQPERLDLRSADVTADRLSHLLELFPEARTEGGRVDFDQLKRALGETVDPGKERYGLTWPGKAECFRTIQTPSLATLRPSPDESVSWDTTENVIIEGDNLEVLKLLQKSYLGKVKMIYIDPPYNTGNDFIYPDNYTESLKTYLEYTGQVDAEGRKFSTNTDTDGRFHSKWLNMMYPRLYLARNLLREDGVIFISIDDGEIASLLRLGDEIFGEEHRLAMICVKARASVSNDKIISTSHNFAVAYAKNLGVIHERRREFGLAPRLDGFDRTDERGRYKLAPVDGPGGAAKGNPYYTFLGVSNYFRFSEERMRSMYEQGLIVKAGNTLQQKYYLANAETSRRTDTTWWDDGMLTSTASTRLVELLGRDAFDNPKPVELISRMLELWVRSPDDIVLDFFAGSGTTGHAVLGMNKEDGGDRKFILVQLPEPTDRDDYPTIADITKERVRRVIAKLDADDHNEAGQDRGFRVFKLDESNIVPWDAGVAHTEATMVEQLQLHVDHIRDDRSPDDILFEILLKTGFPLSTRIEQEEMASTPVFSVADGALLICLSQSLSIELMRAIVERKPERIVFLDEAFANDDALKANASHLFKAAGITFRTV